MEPSTRNTDPGPVKAFDHYLQWAGMGKSGLLRYLAGTLLVIVISLFIGQVFSAVGSILIRSSSPAATIIKTTFFGFIVSFFLVPALVHLLHRRPSWSIAMPVKGIDVPRFVVGIASALIVQLLLVIVAYVVDASAFQYKGADWSSWIPMLFIAFLVFFVQAGTEEMVYRGYLSQFVGRFTHNRFFILLIPALIFAAPHVGNVEGLSGIGALAPYILYGVLYGWLAFRSGSLWMPVGAHLANNWFITMFLGSSDEKIQKMSLFMTSGDHLNPVQLSLSTALSVLLVIGVAELLMRRRRLAVPFPGPREEAR